jgi:hypothetical protein
LTDQRSTCDPADAARLRHKLITWNANAAESTIEVARTDEWQSTQERMWCVGSS